MAKHIITYMESKGRDLHTVFNDIDIEGNGTIEK